MAWWNIENSAYPLHYGVCSCASYDGKRLLQVLKAKIESGFSVNALDGKGYTPLRYCINPHVKKEELVKFLLQHNANPNHRDATGQTLLHQAAWHGDLLFIKLCVQFGRADIHAKDLEGRKPVDLAAIKSHTHIMEYLDGCSIDLRSICRSAIRKAVGKQFQVCLQSLPLPRQIKMFLNYHIPYPGFEAVLLPLSPWTKEDLWQKKIKAQEVRTFMLENGSCEFIEEHKTVLEESDASRDSVDNDLVKAFQEMYLWESFKSVNFEEPVARAPRYSMTKLNKPSK